MVTTQSTTVRDLRSALDEAEAHGELICIDREVEPGYEIPNIARTLSLQPRCPVVLFENIRGFAGWRVATSLNADRARVGRLYNLPSGPLAQKLYLMDRFESPIPPRVVATGPCKENVFTQGIDLQTLIPWTHGSRHVTHRYFQGPVISRDPRTGRQNVAMYRTCIQGPDTATVNGRWDRHLGHQLGDAKRAGQSLPVAIVLGPDPGLIQVAASKFPYGADDFAMLGAIRGEPVELVRCETQDLLVPADAEVVIEGEIRLPLQTGDDGPWPEYLSYLGMNIHPPLMHVTAITHRNDPIQYMIIPRGSGDNSGVLAGALFLRHLRGFLSTFVEDCTLVPASAMHHAVVKVRKTEPHHEGLQLNAALSAFGFLVELDRVVLVDDDIDIYDHEQVEWAVATRCDPATQVHLLCPGRSHQNNPIAGVKEMFGEPITKQKMIIDATIPWRYRVAEKGPGLTFFTRSEWDAVDLGEYLQPADRERWVKAHATGTLTAAMFDKPAGQAGLPGTM